MTRINISKVTGEVFHHNDCTYCIYRQDIPVKEGKKNRTYELCRKFGKRCAPVNDPERFCWEYRESECGCDQCNSF